MAYRRGVRLLFITPGRPVENAFVESFNGKCRDECLNEHWFLSLDEVRATIELEDRLQSRPTAQLARRSHTGRVCDQEQDRGTNQQPTVLTRTAGITRMTTGGRSVLLARVALNGTRRGMSSLPDISRSYPDVGRGTAKL